MALNSEELKPIVKDHAAGIIIAILLATVVLVAAGFYISSQFEKPRAYASATYDPTVQVLVDRDGYEQMRHDYFKVTEEALAAQLELRKAGKKPEETQTTTSYGGMSSYTNGYITECREICVH